MHHSLTVALLAATLACGAAQAQSFSLADLEVKLGATRYTTHSKTSGIKGIGVPAGADAETGDATTVVLTVEWYATPQFGIEAVIGVPPRVKARATGSTAFLGDDILSAKNVSPTLLFNWHFGNAGDKLRPYLGAGINYTRFVDKRSRLASSVSMKDSVGWAVQGGLAYFVDPRFSLWASVAALQTKTDVVAAGSTVLTSTLDFRPIVYSAGVGYRFR